MVISLVLPVTIPTGIAVLGADQELTPMLEPPIVRVYQLDTTIHIPFPALTMLVALVRIQLVAHHLAQASLPVITIPTPHGILIMRVVLGHIRAEVLPHAHVCLLVIIIHMVVGVRTMIVLPALILVVVLHLAQASQLVTIIPTLTQVLIMDVVLALTQQVVPHPVLLLLLDIIIRTRMPPAAALILADLDHIRLVVKRLAQVLQQVTMFQDRQQARTLRAMLARIRLQGPLAAPVYQLDTIIAITTGILTMAVVLAHFQSAEHLHVHRVALASGLPP